MRRPRIASLIAVGAISLPLLASTASAVATSFGSPPFWTRSGPLESEKV
jgi:hypothetical protein